MCKAWPCKKNVGILAKGLYTNMNYLFDKNGKIIVLRFLFDYEYRWITLYKIIDFWTNNLSLLNNIAFFISVYLKKKRILLHLISNLVLIG